MCQSVSLKSRGVCVSNPVVSKADMFQFQLVDPGVSLLFSDELQSSVVVGSIPEEALGSGFCV